MVNPIKANGFTPVQNVFGQTWDASLAVLCVPDDAVQTWDGIFVGMPLVLTNEENSSEVHPTYPLVQPMTDESDLIADLVYGVCVGIGRPGETGDLANQFGMFNPTDLTSRHVTVAEVEADTDGFVIYAVPANGWIFEAQIEAVDDELTVGDTGDVNAADMGADEELGNTTTGICNYEVVMTGTSPSLVLVGFPEYPDNDTELAAAKGHFMFLNAFGNQWLFTDEAVSETQTQPKTYSVATA